MKVEENAGLFIITAQSYIVTKVKRNMENDPIIYKRNILIILVINNLKSELNLIKTV